MRGAYYNEIEPYAAQWLRNLISAGLIAPGDVDERSIAEVQPDDLRGYTQAHFFAGIGVWSHAFRLAGWADDRPVWTGSCPCQPFSAAGKQRGTDDERHLWPEFHRLIRECRPSVVFGEQVASALGRDWLGVVRADLEALGYATAAADLGAASVGAPHIRQRLWWVGQSASGRRERGRHQPTHSVSLPRREAPACIALGDASGEGLSPRQREALERTGRREEGRTAEQPSCSSGRLADAAAGRRASEQHAGSGNAADCGREGDGEPGSGAGRLADASGAGIRDCGPGADAAAARGGEGEGLQRQRLRPDAGHAGGVGTDEQPAASPLYGFWRDADWLLCRDGKWRPVEPGTFPLAHGAPARVGRLRAYGNAIVAPLAAEFISAVMECQP